MDFSKRRPRPPPVVFSEGSSMIESRRFRFLTELPIKEAQTARLRPSNSENNLPLISSHRTELGSYLTDVDRKGELLYTYERQHTTSQSEKNVLATPVEPVVAVAPPKRHKSDSRRNSFYLKSALKAPTSLQDRMEKLLKGCLDMFDIQKSDAQCLFDQEDYVLKSMLTYKMRHPMVSVRQPDELELPKDLHHEVVLSQCPAPPPNGQCSGTSTYQRLNNSSEKDLCQMLSLAATSIPAKKSKARKPQRAFSPDAPDWNATHSLPDTVPLAPSHAMALERLRKRDSELFRTGSDLESDTEETSQFATEEEKRKRKIDQGLLVRGLLWDVKPQDDDEDPKIDEIRLRAIANKYSKSNKSNSQKFSRDKEILRREKLSLRTAKQWNSVDPGFVM